MLNRVQSLLILPLVSPVGVHSLRCWLYVSAASNTESFFEKWTAHSYSSYLQQQGCIRMPPHWSWQKSLFVRDLWVMSISVHSRRYSNLAAGCHCLLQWSFHSLQTWPGPSSELPKCLILCNCFLQGCIFKIALVQMERERPSLLLTGAWSGVAILFAQFRWTPTFPKRHKGLFSSKFSKREWQILLQTDAISMAVQNMHHL